MERTKKYSELRDGDKIWWYGYAGTVRNVREAWIKEDGPYAGERVFRFEIDLEPSKYRKDNPGSFSGATYGGVEHLEVEMRD